MVEERTQQATNQKGLSVFTLPSLLPHFGYSSSLYANTGYYSRWANVAAIEGAEVTESVEVSIEAFVMKKLSYIQLKQQALVFSVADSLEAQAPEELNGMQQCWFDVQYLNSPARYCFAFNSKMKRRCQTLSLS